MAKLVELTLHDRDEPVVVNLDHVISIKGDRFKDTTTIVMTVGVMTVSESYEDVKVLLNADDPNET